MRVGPTWHRLSPLAAAWYNIQAGIDMTLFIYTADINLFTADEEADMRALGMCR